MILKANYHAHTPRCKHAQGSEEDYVLAAIEAGFDTLGFSDHSPWNYKNFVPRIRMNADELEGYVEAVRAAGEKHKGEIKVLCGLECEYFPAYFSWLKEQKQRLGLDYIIMGNHFDTTDESGMYFGRCSDYAQMKHYAEMCIKGLETGEYMYLAHPDLFLANYPEFDENARAVSRELIRACIAMGIPVEFNVLGYIEGKEGRWKGLGYPAADFWRVAAEEGAKCIIGVDAHEPAHLKNIAEFAEAAEFLSGIGMERIERII